MGGETAMVGPVCDWQQEHPRINERLKQLEERETKQDVTIATLDTATHGIREELAGMRGELQGAIWASKMGGAIIGSLVALGGSAAVGLLLFLLTKK